MRAFLKVPGAFLLLTVGLGLLPQAGKAGEPTSASAARDRLAVLDFSVGEDVRPAHRQMAALVREEFQKADRFELIDRNMMRQRMSEKDFAATTECNEVRCLVESGKALDGQTIVGGMTSSFGKTWTLTIRMVDVNTGREGATFAHENSPTMESLSSAACQGARVLLGLEPDSPPAEPPLASSNPALSKELALDLGGGGKLELVLIPAGEFVMGSPDSEQGRDSDEGPTHKVRISGPFYLGKTEVTQAQWQAVMDKNPSKFKGSADLPVEHVLWDDAQEFCRKLSQRVGREIRLPTEAEWEYACRAGTTTAYSFGSDPSRLGEYAWYTENSGGQTHPVGRKTANPWGLYDMHGNVMEWCADWKKRYFSGARTDTVGPGSGAANVLRGGSWYDDASRLRSAKRYGTAPGYHCSVIGFRVAAMP